jgi:hypothetical protein
MRWATICVAAADEFACVDVSWYDAVTPGEPPAECATTRYSPVSVGDGFAEKLMQGWSIDV